MEVPGAGLLTLDAVAIGAEPVLSLAGGCDGGGAAPRLAVLERTAASLLLQVGEAGSYLFRLGSQSFGRSLPEVKVHAAFLPGIGDRSGGGEDPDEIEMEADPLNGNGMVGAVASGIGGRSGEGEDEDEIEMEADPLNGNGVEGAGALCRGGEVDDHGETPRCATSIRAGVPVRGEIRNGWGDDVDLFRLAIPGSPETDLQRLEVTGTSEEVSGTSVDLVVEILDRAGHPLARSEAASDEAGFRLARVLRPGVYFVRVAGAEWSEGAYRLLSTLSVP